jgi:outer membrane protein
MSYVNAIKQSGLAYQAGKMDFQQVKDLTTLNIISLFLQTLNAEDQFAQANFQFSASKVNLDRETNLNNAGAVAPADYYNIKGAHANDALNIVNAQNNVTTARLNLLEAMGVPFNKEIRLVRLTVDNTPVKYDQDASQVYATALNDLALIKAADLRVKAAEKEVLVYKGRLYPTLSLGAGVTTTYSDYAAPGQTAPSFSTQFRSNYQYGPSLNLQIPILNYFQNRNNLRRAKLDLTDAQNTNTDTQVQLKQQVEQAYANMNAAFDRFQAATEQVAAYQAAFNAQEVKFNAGAITADIFVIAKNNLDFANTGLINAHYDYLIRIKILDYYQGKLTF